MAATTPATSAPSSAFARLVRHTLFRPPGIEPAPADGANTRAVSLLSALLIDVTIVALGSHSPFIRPSALRAFAVLNMSLLSLDLVITLGIVRRGGRLADAALPFTVALEAFASVVWIQFTGVLSSYFLFFLPCFVGGYRIGAGYRCGRTALVSVVVFHVGAFVLELLGILPHAPLLNWPASPIDTSRAFGTLILLSIEVTTLSTFGAANFGAWILAEKDIALRAAREELRRVLSEGRPEELIGRTIATRYLVTDFLGSGGMGDVYKATRTEDGRTVAVKILHLNLGAQPTAVARFRRETEAARRLVGARVPDVLDAGTTEEGLHFFAMEWLRGEDLATLLRRRERLPLSEVQTIADELAEVLEVAHASGVVHRDVKPQNVFMVEDDHGARHVHLLDFGIASLLDDARGGLTGTIDVVGTPGYLAPEQVSARYGEVGPATDVFAMGAVLYRALTGRAAFNPTGYRGAVFAALHTTPAPPSRHLPELARDVDFAFAIALAKQSTDRYASASSFARALRSAATSGLSEPSRARARALVAEVEEPTAVTERSDDGET